MLAQSLFAPIPPSAAPAGDGGPAAGPMGGQDDPSFGRLVDQATRPASDQPAPPGRAPPPLRPEVLPGLPDTGTLDKVAEGTTGPQINPGQPTPYPKPVGPEGPQILPGTPDEGIDPPVVAKPNEAGPQILPGPSVADEPPPALDRAKAVPSDAETPRPEILPIEFGPTPQPAAPTAAPAPPPSHPAPATTTPAGAAPPPPEPVSARGFGAEGAAPADVQDAAPAQPAPEVRPPEPVTKPAVAAAPPPVADPPSARADAPGSAPIADAARSAEAAPVSADAPVFNLSRVAHETLAELSAQIVRRLEGRSTRFEMALTPEDLGRVDVSLEVGEDGSLTARLAFDSPAAMADMRGRADELRRQLEQAGFQLARDALEFGQRDGSSGRHDGFERRSNRAFAAARDLADRAEAAPLIALSLSLSPARDRVDVKV